MKYQYVIIGGGIAGLSAVRGIREMDKNGSILLVGKEHYLPYDRTFLSKKLWFGQKKLEEVFLRPPSFYDRNGVTLGLDKTITSLDPAGKTVTDADGTVHSFEKLLLATGGTPRRLAIPGGDLPGVCYLRDLDDYLRLRPEAAGKARTAVVIGGGFIGSEMAAALANNAVRVTMVFPEPAPVNRVFPPALSAAILKTFTEHGITVLTGDKPVSLERQKGKFVARTEKGAVLESDIVIAGAGIVPEISLATGGGLVTGNGIVVNEFLQTSHPDIYAAGDIAWYEDKLLGVRRRVEHWDNGMAQGKAAGRNMAGAGTGYGYCPYFFSDLFEFGYEAVGEVNAEMETFADWKEEYRTGVIYYLKDGKIRGAMLCNIWEKTDVIRELIRKGETPVKGTL